MLYAEQRLAGLGVMITDSLNALVGLALGLVTGFYFERRATKSARLEAANLARQLAELREGIYTVGALQPPTGRVTRAFELNEAEVQEWIHGHQNASGVVARQQLFEHFLMEGCSATDVSKILSKLVAGNTIQIDGEWIGVL